MSEKQLSRRESQTLADDEIEELWKLFREIHEAWGSEACRSEDMASQWQEFIQLKVSESPSFLEHYRLACELLSELRQTHGDRLYQYLFFDGELHRHPDSRLASMKRYVVDEFIRVYVSSGGFRSFGGKNYTGFVSGSRYRSQRPYRSYEGNPYDDYHDLPIESENQSVGKEPWTFVESRLMGRGGSTVHWGGWALRFKEEDFETCSRTGRGADWPISYQDLESYYDQAEQLLGVSGQASDSNGVVLPPRNSEYPLDPFPFVEADRPLIHAMERLGIGFGHMPIARFRKCMTTGTCRYCPFGARFTAAYLLDEIEENPSYTNFKYFDQSPCEQLLSKASPEPSCRIHCFGQTAKILKPHIYAFSLINNRQRSHYQ